MNILGDSAMVNESGSSSNIENYKIAIIGNQHVGKTTILSRYKYETTDGTYAPTVGIDFLTKNVFFEDKTIRLIMWDTAGQERFKSPCAGVVKKADIILLIRDNERDSLDDWLAFLENNTNIESDNIKMLFCLNKTDLLEEEEKKEIKEILLNKAQKYQNSSVLCFSSKNANDIENVKLQIQSFAFNLINKGINSLNEVINICLIGPSMVGKTSLIERVINNEFIESTILTDKLQKNSCYVDLKNNCNIKYNYYDIPGQEKYMKDELNINILKDIDIIIFVNDNKEKQISIKILRQKCRNYQEKDLIFCINKLDLIKNRKAFEKEYKENNKKILGNNEPIFVSALNKEGIDTLKDKINEFIDKKYNLIDDDEKQTSVTRSLHGVKYLDNTQDKKKKSCC